MKAAGLRRPAGNDGGVPGPQSTLQPAAERCRGRSLPVAARHPATATTGRAR
jgi:hypothetical protein